MEMQDIIRCEGYPPRSVVQFYGTGNLNALEIKTFFQQEAAARGVLFSGAHNISYAHRDKEIDKLLSVYTAVLKETKKVITLGTLKENLQGQILQSVFRKV